MQSWLVCYDIKGGTAEDKKRLRRVAICLEDFGERRNYSVFLCRLSATDFARFRARLYGLLDLRQDQVLFVPLCGKCVQEIETLGVPTEPVDARDVVIVS